jgi:hypothetical protein
MGKRFIAGLSATFILAAAPLAWGYGQYVNSIPNGPAFGCNNCHNIGSNPFRTDFKNNNYTWNNALAIKDSDGDVATNGVELQDPQGNWHPGLPQPHINGWSTYNPNNSASTPPYTAVAPQSFGHVKALYR